MKYTVAAMKKVVIAAVAQFCRGIFIAEFASFDENQIVQMSLGNRQRANGSFLLGDERKELFDLLGKPAHVVGSMQPAAWHIGEGTVKKLPILRTPVIKEIGIFQHDNFAQFLHLVELRTTGKRDPFRPLYMGAVSHLAAIDFENIFPGRQAAYHESTLLGDERLSFDTFRIKPATR